METCPSGKPKRTKLQEKMMQTTHYKLNTPCRIALLTDMHNQPWEDAPRVIAAEKTDL